MFNRVFHLTFSYTKGSKQRRNRDLALAVDFYKYRIISGCFKFQPGTAARDNFGAV